MVLPSKLAVAVFLQLVTTIKLASAYCEWGTCKTWEYCCGDNECCGNNDVVFNVGMAICAAMGLLILSCSIFYMFRYFCRFGRPVMHLVFSNYENLSRDRESSTSNLAASGPNVQYNDQMYPDSPPPYSEVVQIRK